MRSYPTALVAGVVTVTAGRLTGWRRWVLLGQGVYQTVAILVPLLSGASGPTWPAEAGWQVGWIVVGAAAVGQAGRTADRVEATSASTLASTSGAVHRINHVHGRHLNSARPARA